MKKPPTKKCHIHEEPLFVYCFDRDLICHHCVADVHRNYKFEFGKIVAPDTKKYLLGSWELIFQVFLKYTYHETGGRGPERL